MICSGVVKVPSRSTTSIAACLRLGVEGVSEVVAVFDMDAENSRIAFATSWTTAGPRGDKRDRFDSGRDGDGDEDAARFKPRTSDETISVIVTCVERCRR